MCRWSRSHYNPLRLLTGVKHHKRDQVPIGKHNFPSQWSTATFQLDLNPVSHQSDSEALEINKISPV